MTDEPPSTPSVDTSTAQVTSRSLARRLRPPAILTRYTRRAIIIGIALAASAIVSLVTIDLGPVVRAQAERAASARIDRPVHIGRLGTYLLPGRFLIEDLVIEGLSPADEHFFSADRIVVTMSWLALLRGEILVDSADMGNWKMLVESFTDGRHSFPRVVSRRPDDSDSDSDNEEVDGEGTQRYVVTTVSQLLAHSGEFVYRDHVSPWGVVARNINLTMEKQEQYGGDLSFTGGTVQIADFKPMTVDVRAAYELDGGHVYLTHIDLTMDGFTSQVTGEVDLLNWPEQMYRIVESDIELPPMKDIFFAEDNFKVTGDASFTGSWHIFDGGRDLAGTFKSANATLNDLRFPALKGDLVWTRDRFEVFETTSGFYGGTLDIDYSMKPLGSHLPGWATLDTTYHEVDVITLLDVFEVVGARPEGRASGRNFLKWPLGSFSDLTGEGELVVAPNLDVRLMTRTALNKGPARPGSYGSVPFAVDAGPWYFPVGGRVSYELDSKWIEIGLSRIATPYTEVEFHGRTAYGNESNIPFRVTSADWQESDRLMASFLAAVDAPIREIAIGGRGQVDGVMLGTFRSPRIEATFAGEDIRAWNVGWGVGRGGITVENGYLDVSAGYFEQERAEIEVNGRFALGARNDGGDEIDANFSLASIPASRVREAFALEGYNIDGPLTGSVRLFGDYGSPFGVGSLTLANPVAYGEPFESATAGLRFEGSGVRVDGLNVRKGEGVVTGAAFIRWDGTYSFNADGRDIAIDSIRSTRLEEAPLKGLAQFTAEGVGAFDNPRYEVRGSVNGLTVRGETVGQVSARIDVRDGVMRLEAEAASNQLAVSGSGRVDLLTAEADLLFRVTNTSIDPYIRAFQPGISEKVSAEVSGTLQVLGNFQDVEQLQLVSTVEQFDLDFFGYTLRNQEPLKLGLDQNIVNVERIKLVGEGTALDLIGEVDLADNRIAVRADGNVDLVLLQDFFSEVRGSGTARLVAEIGGTLQQPLITGEASVDGGRIRHLLFPHGLENIAGRIVFEPDGVRFDELMGELGNGLVQFGGRVGLQGYAVDELNVSATGTEMRLRFPEGVRSFVNVELMLGGGIEDPVLSGTVSVQDAVLLNFFEPSTGILDFTSSEQTIVPTPVESTFPLRFDVRIVAPSSLRISDNTARVVSSAELTLGGTYDQPLVFGNAEIERGEVFFEGNRYRVTRGNIGFANPTAIEPFFDIEAETDVRAPGQTYRVTLGLVGTIERLDFELSSDPPLPEFEIMGLLLGNFRDPQAAELRTLRAQGESRQELFQAGAARLLTSPLSSGIGRVVEESFGVDTFQITPSLVDPSSLQSAELMPTARLLIGKRISDRAHVTLSRTLTGANQDIIVVLEYDQNDHLSWILSQNEDRTYALDFRVRHAF
jgi:hypothetical protein